jgi:proteasome lid subunit RPN8/RPN11
MYLPEEIKRCIKEHSLEDSRKEACGLIIASNRSHELRVFRCKNASSHPEDHFEISPRSYVRASRTGKIVAVYHSHTSGTKGFSGLDMLVSENHNIKSILYNVEDGSFHNHEPSNYKANIWTNRADPSIFTCFKAVIGFYKEVLSLDISVNTKKLQELQEQRTLRKNVEILVDKEFYKMEGFIGVHDGPIDAESKKLFRKYDVIGLKYFDITAHLLIYLGDNKVFHHTRYGYPRVEKLTRPMEVRAKGVVRHLKFA